ncbi:MAG: TrbG/VirB9 family P-type conjugative transfer protein [Selenomonadaceae bacterium]|nr:TrbG/VirB9 family P-type conjugative transfer protein [Selenomonadaceae bacterium]MBR3721663.1 TrbG/VirB9 family P-type conjugative transfer protein [Selenomonadaceae bacterium]
MTINKKKLFLSLALSAVLLSPSYSFAEDDIDAKIREQQKILQELNQQKSDNNSKEMQKKLDKLDAQLKQLAEKADKKPSYDAKGAIDSIAAQILDLRKQIEETTKSQERIAELLNKLEQRDKEREEEKRISEAESVNQDIIAASGTSNRYLVNPGDNKQVGYTQDAINSQGNSTMVFAYYPDQLYKIYCRKGYLTDLAFKKGEQIKFVGGGDTAGWMVNNTEVDGVPHLYIKPVVDVSTTNLIVTTNKRSYQLIVNTSNWYNPMVRWTYGAEDKEANLLKQKKEERVVTGNIRGNVENLDFDYKVEGKGEKPTMIFSDGEQTYIKFASEPSKKVPLFVREKGKKQMALVNYRIKDNYFIVEKVFTMAQLRYSEDEVLTIKHK